MHAPLFKTKLKLIRYNFYSVTLNHIALRLKHAVSADSILTAIHTIHLERKILDEKLIKKISGELYAR